jgi:hypothetical protein
MSSVFEGKKETAQETIDRLAGEGYRVTRRFTMEHTQQGLVDAYLKELESKSKKPHEDFKFFIDGDDTVVLEKE